MYPHFKVYESFLTNGDISIKIEGDRNHCGIRLPKGVIFAEDSSGNMYLNGIRAWVELRCTAES